MENIKKYCRKCEQIIKGDIYRISTTDYDVRDNNKKVGEKYEDYCRDCYVKLPVGIRPFDHKENGRCQTCNKSRNCGKKGCSSNNCLDSISHICVDC